MKMILYFFLFLPLFANALEVDEKLTVRLVKISESKKTVMLNRGTEDGLVEGDHAKLIVTAGIVARAVCIKVSPTRSVWSIYRLVNADFIVNDSVMSIKITPPVKITKDESQALVQEDIPTSVVGDPSSLGIPLADGAQDLPTEADKLSQSDLKALEDNNVPISIVDKNVEIFGFLNVSGLSANTKTNIGDQKFNSSQSFHHLGLGGEYYGIKEREWYARFSLLGQIAFMRENSQAYNGAAVTNELTEFSLGLNWHPTKLPSVTNEFIPYFHLAFNYGSVNSSYKNGTNSGTPDLSSSGSSNGFSIGAGYKFYTFKGYGARFIVDYYRRTETYKEDIIANTHNKSVSGPRLLLAVSYRF
jgi:hypothetical protein